MLAPSVEDVVRKIRSEAVWAAVREAWEGGETARSLARRYDVGVHALWKRREAEGWVRPDPVAGPIEPPEGWDAYAQNRRNDFETRLEEVRELASDLVAAMRGAPLDDVPLWHLSFIYDWRAEHLGPEVAAMDHERARDKAWAGFWDEEGRLKSLGRMDREMMRLNRDEWREQVGLPPGKASWCP
ncbi:hypothetical protein [Brevundimonas vesicularis]|uniref:hypothetical protein n=1 Tax=Brevundimonas vesicularis TaxID=41276 RepID=UPI0038D4B7D9